MQTALIKVLQGTATTTISEFNILGLFRMCLQQCSSDLFLNCINLLCNTFLHVFAGKRTLNGIRLVGSQYSLIFFFIKNLVNLKISVGVIIFDP